VATKEAELVSQKEAELVFRNQAAKEANEQFEAIKIGD